MPRDLRRYQKSGQSHFVTFIVIAASLSFTTPRACNCSLCVWKRCDDASSSAFTLMWSCRYYDRNVRSHHEFMEKLETGVVEIESEWTARDREKALVVGPDRMFLNPG